MNKALHQPAIIKARLRSQNKRRLPQMLHRSPIVPTGLHYWSTRMKQHKGQDLHRAPPWAWLRHLHGLIGTCKLVLEVSVSHGDSAISHPRDQDYLSLWVSQRYEVELQIALAYIGANIRKWEREEKAKARSNNYDQEVILEQPTSSITPTPCSLLGLFRKETITVTHAVDAF